MNQAQQSETVHLDIAPVRKSIRVAVPQARAFEVFTAGLGRWWPKKASIGAAPMKTMIMEPRLGGRWYELGEDGSEATVGTLLAWEPPYRFVVSWDINGKWKPQPAAGSEVEVRFVADGADATLVELEHRLFERLGEAAGAKIREDVNGGWPSMLDAFKTEAEK